MTTEDLRARIERDKRLHPLRREIETRVSWAMNPQPEVPAYDQVRQQVVADMKAEGNWEQGLWDELAAAELAAERKA